MMTATQKQVYKCCFNYGHEIIIKYAWAWSGRQAKNFAMRRLAKEHDVHPSHIFALFDGSKNNFSVEREVAK